MKPDAELLSPAGRDLLNRRGFLAHSATGLGALALTGLLDRDGLLAADEAWRPDIDPQKPHAARTGHYTGRAKQVLVIFCSGACSHVDTWDYKPELVRLDGQPMPGDAKLVTFQGENGALTKSPYAFRRRGQCGKFTSDLLPRLGEMVDDMCFVHSLTSKTNTHGPGENYMSTGFTLDGFPSVGAWTTYALGSECDDLPAFVAIPDPRGVPQSSINNWGPGFLPAMFQGTPFNAQQPIRYLQPPVSISADEDLATRDFLRRLNERHLEAFPGDTTLAARIASYELAARMQLSVPEVSDLDSEPEHVLRMYGADDANTIKAGFARNCILARRLLERGVRFVQLFNGAYAMGEGVGNWDGHKTLKDQYDKHGPVLDQPAAALLKDLKQRGLLRDTLVVWCTEFGRMPTFQKGASGRDHNPSGFTAWLAGAGVRAPFEYGATDDFGYRAVENVLTVHDLHATMLHLVGLNHERLTYYHNGLERRLTDVHGHVVKEILDA
ncbi:MAG: DUF1501 domain-containing protein [Planctomycetales bacterium]|nr:DUF1501 domain-containing protein [Planctomycetales bacterium]